MASTSVAATETDRFPSFQGRSQNFEGQGPRFNRSVPERLKGYHFSFLVVRFRVHDATGLSFSFLVKVSVCRQPANHGLDDGEEEEEEEG